VTGTGAGPGWTRLALAVAELVPPAEVDGVWLFSPLRRVDGHRRRIYTARYVLAVRGKERGKFESAVQEVGSGPVEALAQLLQEAQRRIDDEHPPHPVAPDAWFAAAAAAANGPPR